MQPFTMTKAEHGDGAVCTAIIAATGHTGPLRHRHDPDTGDVTIYLQDGVSLDAAAQALANFTPAPPPAPPSYYTTDELDAAVDGALTVAALRAHLKLLHAALGGKIEKP